MLSPTSVILVFQFVSNFLLERRKDNFTSAIINGDNLSPTSIITSAIINEKDNFILGK
jgi:hypothetical protein